MTTLFLRPTYLVLFALLSSIPTWAKGVINAGGGYAIRCDDGRYYALDYVMAKGSGTKTLPAIANAKDANEILRLIQAKLAKSIPTMAASLADFMKFNRDELNFATKRLWVDGSYPLAKLDDEVRNRIPTDCLAPNKEPDTYQAIVRRQVGEQTYYDVDAENIRRLEETGPLQLSYAYIHEWLRDYTDDPKNIQEVNQLLHSERFFQINPFQAAELLNRHGIAQASALLEEFPEDSLTFSWDGKLRGDYVLPGDYRASVEICSSRSVDTQIGSYDEATGTCHNVALSQPASVVYTGALFWKKVQTKDAVPMTAVLTHAKFMELSAGLKKPLIFICWIYGSNYRSCTDAYTDTYIWETRTQGLNEFDYSTDAFNIHVKLRPF